jgi:hypothetical protein
MFIFRLSFLVLLISAWVAPAAAQTSPDWNLASSEPQLDGLVAPPEFRGDGSFSLLPQNGEDRTHATPLQFSPLRLRTMTEQDDSTCLYIRGYRVTRDDPKSDATMFAGYSTCQPAARFQTKSAVETVIVETSDQ